MRTVAGAILIHAAAVCLASAVITGGFGPGSDAARWAAAALVPGAGLGMFGLVLLVVGLFTDRPSYTPPPWQRGRNWPPEEP
jgi:hypothetical protein